MMHVRMIQRLKARRKLGWPQTRLVLRAIAVCVALFWPLHVFADDTIRISFLALKNFGDSRAGDAPKLEFIADRIAEEAVLGVTVVDELQDSDESAFAVLKQAVNDSAKKHIDMALSKRVGGNKKEQFGFFWNPALVRLKGDVGVQMNARIERDPGVATFTAVDGFDFTLVAFHTRPSGAPLRQELHALAPVLEAVQDQDTKEQDVIFIGDFNAPPEDRKGQNDSIRENLGALGNRVTFAIRDAPTNVKQDKIFDNVFFDRSCTDEYIDDGQHVVRLDALLKKYKGTIPGKNEKEKVEWFYRNVLDHCPVYANFRADKDSD